MSQRFAAVLAYWRRHSRRALLDAAGIALLALAGAAGLVYAADPIRYRHPGVPLLAPRDWPGSTAIEPLREAPGSTADVRPFAVRLEVDLPPKLALEGNDASLWQRATWYRDPAAARQAWEAESRPEDLGVSTAGPVTPLPGSLIADAILWCGPSKMSPETCVYQAAYNHWRLEMWLWDRKDYLSPEATRSLIRRAEELLLAAPEGL